MAKIHTLTYNGTKSSDLGVFVSGSGSFDAAEFDVDKYEIPGRNGDLILSNNRYKNIEITYPAFIPKAFMDKVQNVRNWLRSSRVYARLEDTYDMDHYRLGIPTGVQSFSPENRNDGANFEMTFDCKPQRFLKVGETPETVEADVQTESGEIVTFETVAESPITSAEVSLSPIQSLNGYDSPWPAWGGVNKCAPRGDGTATNNGVTMSANGGVYTLSGTSTGTWVFDHEINLPAGTYSAAFFNDAIAAGSCYIMDSSFNVLRNIALTGANKTETFTLSAAASIMRIRGTTGFTYSNVKLSPMIVIGSTAPATFSPYSNICPISGHTGAELNVAAEYDAEDKTTYSVTFSDQGTVYGGTYDFVTGKLKVTMASVNLGSLTWNRDTTLKRFYAALPLSNPTDPGDVFNGISSIYRAVKFNLITDPVYIGIDGVMGLSAGKNLSVKNLSLIELSAADFATAMSGQTLAYELATPIEYTLSPQQLTTLLGQNVVWGSGTITLTYAEPYNIENPTLFDARPLFTVTNPAEGDVIMVNGQAITFVDGYSGTVYIDCETMNAFSGAANLNSIIQATDFPVLVPGTNIVTWTGTGECTMTPRWWEL